MYFHVIGSTAEEDIKRGVDLATSLITAMVDAAPAEGSDVDHPEL